jgi:hypothetical protein
MAVWIEGAMEETAKWGVSTGLAVVAPLVGPDLPSRAIAQPPSGFALRFDLLRERVLLAARGRSSLRLW